jgi:hypothetical protein
MIIKLQWKNYESGGSHVSFDSEEIATLIEAKDGSARVTLKSGYSMTAVETFHHVHDLWVEGRAHAEGVKMAAAPPTDLPPWHSQAAKGPKQRDLLEESPDPDDDDWHRNNDEIPF